MKKYTRFILLGALWFHNFYGFSQNLASKIDSASKIYQEARMLFIQGSPVEAHPLFLKAAELFDAVNRKDSVAKAYLFAGLSTLYGERYEKALLELNIAEDLAFSSLQKGDGTRLQILIFQGACYTETNRPYKGNEKLSQAILELKHSSDTSFNGLKLAYLTHSNYANTFIPLGNYDSAQVNFDKAMAIATQMGPMGILPQVILSINKSDAYFWEGKLDSALNNANKGLSLLAPFSNYRGSDQMWSDLYFNRGLIYQEEGKSSQAIKEFQKSMNKVSPYSSPSDPMMRRGYWRLGQNMANEGRHLAALTNFQKSLSASSRGFPPDSPIGENPELSKLLRSIRSLSLLLDKAESLIALSTGSKGSDCINWANQTYDLASKLADSLYETEIWANHTIDLGLKISDTLLLSGYYNEKDGGLNLAELTNKLLEHKASLSLKQFTMKKDWNIPLTLAGEQMEPFWELSESSKSNLLLQGLRSQKIRTFSKVPDSVKDYESVLGYHINLCEENLLSEEKRLGGSDHLKIDSLESRLDSLRRTFKVLVAEMRNQYPLYALKYEKIKPEIETIQKSLLDKNQGLIEFYLTDCHLYTFALSKDTAIVLVNNRLKDLDKHILNFREGITNSRILEPEAVYQKYVQSAHRLYEELMEPTLALLGEEVTRLIIIPDGVLNSIAFDLLLTKLPEENLKYRPGSYSYLIRDYAISYDFSASLSLLFRELGQEFGPIPLQRVSYKGFAYSKSPYMEENETTEAGFGLSSTRRTLNSLPFAKREILESSALFNGDSWIDDTLSERQFYQQAKGGDILHMAMHSIVDEEEPLNSYFLMGLPSNKESEGDNRLYASEIYGMSLDAKMAILSACNTGQGTLYEGEGVLSLARAFSHAGVPSIMMGLWDIPDAPTYEVITNFLELMKEGVSKDVALQRAKLSYLEKNPRNTKAYYWGGLVVIGDPSPIVKGKSVPWGWIVGLASILVLFVMILFMRLWKQS